MTLYDTRDGCFWGHEACSIVNLGQGRMSMRDVAHDAAAELPTTAGPLPERLSWPIAVTLIAGLSVMLWGAIGGVAVLLLG